MTKGIIWRCGVAAFAIFIALIYLIPSLPIYNKIPDGIRKILPKNKIHLGLDLRGGIHLVLDVGVNKAVESHLDRMVDELKHEMRKNKIRYRKIKKRQKNTCSSKT